MNTKFDSMSIAEIVLFKQNPGVSDESLLSAARGIDEILSTMLGFKSRHILRASDGRWVDLVWWNTLEEAEQAAEKVMSLPKCQKFFGLIEQESMQFLHASLPG